jgi:hypothetical protein
MFSSSPYSSPIDGEGDLGGGMQVLLPPPSKEVRKRVSRLEDREGVGLAPSRLETKKGGKNGPARGRHEKPWQAVISLSPP